MPSKARFLRPYDPVLLAGAVVLVLVYVNAAGGGFPLDDSWIHQVYGRNLAETGQWAFVPGQPSAASTAPLYTVLLAAGYALGVSYQVWTHLLGVVALFITTALGARMAERLAPGQKLAGWLAGGVLVLAWHLVWSAVSGMETMLFSMFTLVLIALAWHERDTAAESLRAVAVRGGIFGVLAALTTLTRPEGVMLAGLVGLLILILRPQHGLRGALVWGVAAGLGFVVAMLPYLLLNLELTGGLLPDTAAAKQAQAAVLLATLSYPARVWRMLEPLTAGGQLLLLPGMICFAVICGRALREDHQRGFDLLLLLWPAALILLYAARLPAAYQHGRYVIPVLPALIVAGVVGSVWLVRVSRHSLLGRVMVRALMISSLVVFVYFGLLLGPATYARDVRIIDEEMVTAAHWIRDNVPPENLLAIHDIGAVGYFAPRSLLDIAGLVSPELIPLIGDEAATWAFLEAQGARYLMAFPNQVPGGEVDDPHLCPVFTTNNPTAREAGGHNMSVYALAWDGVCPESAPVE